MVRLRGLGCGGADVKIMADYLLNHHSEELDDSDSPDDYDDTDY